MKHDLAAAIRSATRLTRSGDLMGATRAIQEALTHRGATVQPVASAAGRPAAPPALPTPESLVPASGAARTVEASPPRRDDPPRRDRRPLAAVLRALREGKLTTAAAPDTRPATRVSDVPQGADFAARSFTSAAGTRRYKLYVPAAARGRPAGLVVMLHGCKQDPDDFAAGTRMNELAERHGLLVAYPAQTSSANISACWNWFDPAHQARGNGEPAIIAGITQEIAAEFGLGRDRTFVAGLSAGGAMAAVMGATYPDLYAAIGVHSGLAYRSASDVVSAFAAMRGDSQRARSTQMEPSGQRVRTIVFQGTADQTVSAANGEPLLEAAGRGLPDATRSAVRGSTAGRGFTRSVIAGKEGPALVEYWLIDGAGHAWSGGDPRGSFADRTGPDASAEMMRFFLEAEPRAADGAA